MCEDSGRPWSVYRRQLDTRKLRLLHSYNHLLTHQPHCSHPSEPQCSYDPVEGLTLAPDTDPLEKIKQLEEQISHLKNRLYEKDLVSHSSSNQASDHLYSSNPVSPPSTSRSLAEVGRISLPHASLSMMSLASESPESAFRSLSRTPENPPAIANKHPSGPTPGPFMDMLFIGWNPELPDPATLNH
ncbi:hypothetical protein DXG03_007106 [Asterophora parasitica]|uniref:Uncharacterized protein n=1 Tax=Asterophora parasitica TaxID=117018 RepID=A0A9P7KDJ0_9AGAR|nr:hypothetical protein DXG03_007106 [Asterophora parasitica]